jgi:putative transposase
VPKPYPKELRDDVMNVARNREPDQTIKQIAAGFGNAESCLRNWIRAADVGDGLKPGTTAADIAELREAKKRIRLLEQKNEVLRRTCRRRTCRENDVPARPRARRRRDPRDGDVPGARPRPPALLPVARLPVTDAELSEAYLANALFDAHRDDPEFGCRYIADEARDADQTACDRTTWRVCSSNGWWSAFGKKRGKNGTASAVAHRGEAAGCILHTDRAQFRSRKFVRALHRHEMVGSVGKVGAAGDNAAMESFFALLQKNVLDRRTWETRQELRIAIVTWIERTYHRRRRQAALGRRLTPIEYETIMTTPAVQAA